MKLLTQNIKLKKDPKYNVWGLDLAPYTLSGYNTCAHAGVCKEVCIGVHSGFNKMPVALEAKIRRARQLFTNREQFLQDLHDDLSRLEKTKDKRPTFVRLNVDSDIPWESVDKTIFEHKLSFYDYTKYVSRAKRSVEGKMFSNYVLTYSLNEKSKPKDVSYLLDNGGNINMVVSIPYSTGGELPKHFQYNSKIYQTVDGDASDVRHSSTDGYSKIIMVRAKMRKNQIAEYVKKGFVVSA